MVNKVQHKHMLGKVMQSSLDNLKLSMKEIAGKLAELKASVRKDFDAYLANEDIPLFDRWNIFIVNCGEIYEVAGDVSGIPREVLNHIRDMYDIDRYQTKRFVDVFDEMTVPDNTVDYYSEVLEDFNNIPENVVRGIITSGYSGFIYDW